MQPLRVLILLVIILLTSSSMVRAADPFASFIVGLRSACGQGPSTHCVGAVSAFLDTNASGRIELRELRQASHKARLSVRNKASMLRPLERNMIAVALMVMHHAGLAQVFSNFDTNADGGLSNEEMFADFRIDQRPFGTIVKDPKSVNWKTFAQRFGKVGFLITDLLPPLHRR
jgi:hypothetical protein